MNQSENEKRRRESSHRRDSVFKTTMSSSSALDSRNSSQNDPVARIRRILGDQAVLIAVRPLTKKPFIKGWQKVTRSNMDDPVYLESLVGVNIGVSLGRASGGLCTIDLDNDADIEPFLAANPRLRGTTQTKRVRGCNFWIYIDGKVPRSRILKTVEGGVARPVGEWRADRHQTIIFGRAIDRKKGETKPTEYKFLNEVPPVRIGFDEIVFPNGGSVARTPATPDETGARGILGKSAPPPPPIRLNPESCISASLRNCVPASLHNKAGQVVENIRAKREALDSLRAKHPNLARLYSELIEPRFQAQPHARNDFIIQAVPFLYRVVAAQFVLELVRCFYDCNRALFNDPREQHMKEAEAMLESVAKTYTASLNSDERRIYDALAGHEQEAFRICRDLSMLERIDRERGEFYMSFNQLGDRLGIYPTQAQRVMRQLEGYGLVKLLKKGTRRAPGVPAQAGIYRWFP